MIEINELTVTQEGFRNEDQITSMVDFVAKGGVFNSMRLYEHSNGKDTRKINLVRFEDGRLYIHDGHHRVAAVYLGNRDILFDEEYEITSWTYAQYIEIKFEKRWITPFDPRSEVRVCDYEKYKNHIWWMHSEHGEEEATTAIEIRRSEYLKDRRSRTIQDMLKDLRCPG